jgi:trans-2,3-dihydro-3-hydroxyanthranilate isomerase
MRRPYLVLDVFTSRRFAGNPLAVLPLADRLDARVMQAIAAELNLSETVFVTAPDELGHLARLRIFTPRAELPFAGHPTVGAALALAHLGRVACSNGAARFVLGEAAGAVPVTVTFRAGSAVRAEFQAPQPPSLGAAVDTARCAALLGVDEAAIVRRLGLPAVISCGTPFLAIEVRGLADLAAVRITDPALVEGDLGVLVVTREVAPDDDADWRARMFAPAHGLAEDPATGSAAAAFAGALALAGGARQAVLAQGVEMGRPSRIETRVEPGVDGTLAVLVAGTAVLVAEGFIETGGL